MFVKCNFTTVFTNCKLKLHIFDYVKICNDTISLFDKFFYICYDVFRVNNTYLQGADIMQFFFRRIMESLVTSIIISLVVVMASATGVFKINIINFAVSVFSLILLCIIVFLQAREHYDAIEDKKVFYKTNIFSLLTYLVIACVFCFFAQISNFLKPYYSLVFSPMKAFEYIYGLFIESDTLSSWLSLITSSFFVFIVILIVPLVFTPTHYCEE